MNKTSSNFSSNCLDPHYSVPVPATYHSPHHSGDSWFLHQSIIRWFDWCFGQQSQPLNSGELVVVSECHTVHTCIEILDKLPWGGIEPHWITSWWAHWSQRKNKFNSLNTLVDAQILDIPYMKTTGTFIGGGFTCTAGSPFPCYKPVWKFAHLPSAACVPTRVLCMNKVLRRTSCYLLKGLNLFHTFSLFQISLFISPPAVILPLGTWSRGANPVPTFPYCRYAL